MTLTRERVLKRFDGYRALRLKIDTLRNELDRMGIDTWEEEEIESRALGRITSGMPHSSRISDKTSSIAVAMSADTTIRDMLKELNDFERDMRELNTWMDALEHKMEVVMRLRYMHGMRWADVLDHFNDETKYPLSSECQIRNIRENAIRTILSMVNGTEYVSSRARKAKG